MPADPLAVWAATAARWTPETKKMCELDQAERDRWIAMKAANRVATRETGNKRKRGRK